MIELVTMSDQQLDSILGPGAAEKARLSVYSRITGDGRAARAMGGSLDTCPPFVVDEMALCWRVGWYDEDTRCQPRKVETATAPPLAAAPDPRPKREKRRYNPHRNNTCPRCGALSGRACISATGKVVSDEHAARYGGSGRR